MAKESMRPTRAPPNSEPTQPRMRRSPRLSNQESAHAHAGGPTGGAAPRGTATPAVAIAAVEATGTATRRRRRGATPAAHGSTLPHTHPDQAQVNPGLAARITTLTARTNTPTASPAMDTSMPPLLRPGSAPRRRPGRQPGLPAACKRCPACNATAANASKGCPNLGCGYRFTPPHIPRSRPQRH